MSKKEFATGGAGNCTVGLGKNGSSRGGRLEIGAG